MSDTKKKNFKYYLLVTLKGILLGLISLGVPGFSASTIGLIIGIYTLMVENIANIFKTPKKSIPFLIALMIGYGLGAIGAACSISILFDYFPLITTMCIMALIFGSIPEMVYSLKGNFKKVSNWIVFVVIVAFLIIYNYLIQEGTIVEFPERPSLSYLIFILIIGVITSVTFIVPGIDFAVVFLSIGLYYPFMGLLKDVVSFGKENYLQTIVPKLELLLFYVVGYFIGIFLFSKLIKFLSKKYSSQSQFASLAFVVAAIPIVLRNCLPSANDQINAVDLTFKGFLIGGILSFILLVVILVFSFVGKDRCGRYVYATLLHPFIALKNVRTIAKSENKFLTAKEKLHDFAKYEKITLDENVYQGNSKIFIVDAKEKYCLNAMMLSQTKDFVYIDDNNILGLKNYYASINKISEKELNEKFEDIIKNKNIVIFYKKDKLSCSNEMLEKLISNHFEMSFVNILFDKAIYNRNYFDNVSYKIVYSNDAILDEKEKVFQKINANLN